MLNLKILSSLSYRVTHILVYLIGIHAIHWLISTYTILIYETSHCIFSDHHLPLVITVHTVFVQ